MRKSKLFFYTGVWIFVLLGIGHFIGVDLFRNVFVQIENKDALVKLMSESNATFMGGRANMLLAFYYGFSLSHAVLLILFGTVNLLFAKLAFETILKSPSIIIVNAIAALCELVLAVKFWFYFPTLMFGLAFVCFVLVYVFRSLSSE